MFFDYLLYHAMLRYSSPRVVIRCTQPIVQLCEIGHTEQNRHKPDPPPPPPPLPTSYNIRGGYINVSPSTRIIPALYSAILAMPKRFLKKDCYCIRTTKALFSSLFGSRHYECLRECIHHRHSLAGGGRRNSFWRTNLLHYTLIYAGTAVSPPPPIDCDSHSITPSYPPDSISRAGSEEK